MIKELKLLLLDVFSPSGWLIENGYVVNKAQKDYAFKVLESLEESGKFNFLEAGTGVGKSFGYALPLIAYAVLSKRRVILATHSIALQKNLLDETIGMVEKCLLDHGYSLPIIEQRIGMQHFVDPFRVEAIINKLPKLDANLKEAFVFWAQETAGGGIGLVEEWQQEYGELPKGISLSDICLTPYSKEKVNVAYEQQKQDTQSADVIVTSHMMMISSLTNNALGDYQPGDIVLVDEADTLPNTIEYVTNRHVRLSHINKTIESLIKCFTKKSTEVADRIIQSNNDVMQLMSESPSGYRPFVEQSELVSHTDHVSAMLKEIPSLKLKRSFENEEEDYTLLDLTYQAKVLSSLLSGNSSLLSMYKSPVRHERSYVLGLYKPSIILRRLTKQGVSLICTSATLKNRVTSDPAPAFTNYAISLGVSAKDIHVTAAIEPEVFGKVEYVLSDKKAPSPFIKGNTVVLNKSWLKYVSRMIKDARSTGDRLLVLVSSYNEACELSKLGLVDDASFHVKGRVTQAFNDFKASGNTCFVTPAGWSGFSFREDGKQFFNGVLVTKVPFIPPNDMAVLRKAYELSADCILDESKLSLAQTYTYRTDLEASIAKLMQGFGRLIRSATDSGVIWIADHRFPHVGCRKHSHLRNAIPLRFLEQYENHKISLVDGGGTENNTQPKIEQVIGFI
jgi:ATP-dependent DNA helicase DinG